MEAPEKQDKEQIPVSIAPREQTLFASENEIYVISLLLSGSFADNAKPSFDGVWLAVSTTERAPVGIAEFDSGQA